MGFNPVQIGNLNVERPLALAPMAGVTNWPFRLLCKEKGCGLVVTEFVNDNAVLSGNAKTRDMVRILDAERPAAVQIFGHNPDTMARAAQVLTETINPDYLDINMGCPAPKITKGRGGSSLLLDPANAEAIVRSVAAAVQPLPVTVKMRIGWDRKSIVAVEFAQRMEQAGAKLITVHGRTREQQYGGQADWDTIALVARAVTVPVFGNGDITTPREAAQRLQDTGVAGIAIGRGALGNPWVFERTCHYLVTGELLPEPGAAERVQMALRHLDLMIQAKGGYIATREMRKHAAWYLKGLAGAAQTRGHINTAETPDQLRAILLDFQTRHLAGFYTPATPATLGGTDESCPRMARNGCES